MKRLNERIREKDKRSQNIAKQLREFLHTHDKQLTTHAHGMTSTTQALKASLEEITADMLSKVRYTQTWS